MTQGINLKFRHKINLFCRFKKYSPGVIGCMKEIEFIRNQNQIANVFKYYYLGYYIHKSKKMSYKGDYEPSELLCPVSLKWVDFKYEIRKKFEIEKNDEWTGTIARQGNF